MIASGYSAEDAKNSGIITSWPMPMKRSRSFTSEAIVHAKGSMQRPLSASELEDKFLDCVGDQLADNAKTNTFEKLMNLERLNGASDLLSLQ